MTAKRKVSSKLYILDTNVLIHDPKSMLHFAGAHVGIPVMVLEELDKFKNEGTERGRNAREAIRQLDFLREKGSLGKGIKLDNGEIIQVLFFDQTIFKGKLPLFLRPGDNEIILAALSFMQQGWDVIFISKDLNARVKADALGITTEDYVKEKVTEKEFYQGWIRVDVPAVELKRELPSILSTLAKEKEVGVNEFVLVESHHNQHNYRVFRYYGDHFKPVLLPHFNWPLNARNAQQLMALDLLLDPAIQFICLFGPAGTGKTFLVLLAALHEIVFNKRYERLLISRPVVPLGHDIGYLPGTVGEKLQNWMLPIYDNMDYITHTINDKKAPELHTQQLGAMYNVHGKHHKQKHKKNNKKSSIPSISLEDLLHKGIISMEAITYMRGRSIPYQYILIDEAQNLNPHEIKTLVSRAGEGSKIILTGDPYQIDSPYLDFTSNGLVVASERFKGQKIFGSVFLNISERSELSKLATELL